MAVRIGPDAATLGSLDLLLIHPRYPMPHWPILPHACLNLAQYAALRGFNVGVWDPNLDPRATDDALHQLLAHTRVRWAGLSLLSTQLPEARRLARCIRAAAPDTRIVAGGQHFAAATAGSLPEADVVVLGEGEHTLAALLAEATDFPSSRATAAALGSGPAPHVLRGAPLTNIDELPPLEPTLFRTFAGFGTLTRLGLLTARGCPFTCSFCHVEGRTTKVRRHTPARVGDLIATAHAHTGLEEIFFLDDVFTLDPHWAGAVCAEIHRRGLAHLRYACFSHVRVGHPALYATLSAAGFRHIQLGIESGDETIRRRMGKHFTQQQIRATVRAIQSAGIEAHALFILGYAGESLATMQATLDLAESLETTAWFSLAQPLPGTRFHDEARHSGTLLEHDPTRFGNERIVYLPAGVSLAQMRQVQEAAERLRVRLQNRWSRQPAACN